MKHKCNWSKQSASIPKMPSLRIHSTVEKSRANGPGVRAVVWVQGCPFTCPGCFNPGLKDPKGGNEVTVEDLFQWIRSVKGIEGITISGGEPTEQIPALVALLERVKEETNLSVLLFSGRTLKEILSLPMGDRLVSLLDVLIDGPYDPALANPPGVWPSSSNQQIHLLTSRYAASDFSNLPFQEVVIAADGEIVESGLFYLLHAPR